jgi:hypothetical protein
LPPKPNNLQLESVYSKIGKAVINADTDTDGDTDAISAKRENVESKRKRLIEVLALEIFHNFSNFSFVMSKCVLKRILFVSRRSIQIRTKG